MKKTKGVPNPSIDYKILVREPISPQLITEFNKRKTFKFLKAKKKYKINKNEYPFIDHIFRKGYFTKEQLELLLEVIMTLTPKCNEFFYKLSTLYTYKDWDELNEIFNESDWISSVNSKLNSDINKLDIESKEIQEEVIQLKEKLRTQQNSVDNLNTHIERLAQKRTFIPLYIELINLINIAKQQGERIVKDTMMHDLLSKHWKAEDNEYLNFQKQINKKLPKIAESFRVGFNRYCKREGIII